MPRIIARPDAIDLDSPGRRDYWVALEHDGIWADHLIPLTVIVGPDTQKGEGLVAFGSNHGNEYEGPVALKHLVHEIDEADVTGRIILVPVLNPGAFKAGTRQSGEDGVNLNRAFLDGAGENPAISTITYRIARFVRDYIWPRVHIVIDIHSAGAAYEMIHTTSYHPVDSAEQTRAIEETARWFGTPFVMTYQNQTPGLLPSEAERLGKITIGTEMGNGNAVNPDGVRWSKQGVRAAAINHGLMRGEISPIDYHADGTQQRVALVDRDCYVVAPFSGHYEPLYRAGTFVKKGQTAGYLHSFEHIDDPPYPIVPKLDGVIGLQSFEAPVKQGVHVLVVGQVESFVA